MRKINVFVMTIAGLLLIVASILKFQEMLATCVPSWTDNKLGFWESYEFFLIQIPLEFALGVWMVCGLFRKAAWIAGTCAYFGFILVTIFKVVTGAESCGCFGQVHVDPKITLFTIDIPLFLLLAIFRPRGLKLLPPPWPNLFYLLAVAIPTIGLMVLAAPAMVTFKPACIKADDTQPDKNAQYLLELHKLKQELAKQKQETGQLKLEADALRQKIEILQQQVKTVPAAEEPNTIVSPEPPIQTPAAKPAEPTAEPNAQPAPAEPWDWLTYVVQEDVKSELSSGLDIVLMYHHDCPTCADIVPRYSDFCKQMAEQGNEEFRITFLAVPPYAETGPVPADTTCVLGKLTDKQDWQIMSPYVVALLDGQLVKTWKQGTAPEPEKILDEVFGQ